MSIYYPSLLQLWYFSCRSLYKSRAASSSAPRVAHMAFTLLSQSVHFSNLVSDCERDWTMDITSGLHEDFGCLERERTWKEHWWVGKMKHRELFTEVIHSVEVDLPSSYTYLSAWNYMCCCICTCVCIRMYMHATPSGGMWRIYKPNSRDRAIYNWYNVRH